MGARSCCRKCDAPLSASSFHDIEEDFQECPHCHAVNPLNRTMSDVLQEMDERLTALEALHGHVETDHAD